MPLLWWVTWASRVPTHAVYLCPLTLLCLILYVSFPSHDGFLMDLHISLTWWSCQNSWWTILTTWCLVVSSLGDLSVSNTNSTSGDTLRKKNYNYAIKTVWLYFRVPRFHNIFFSIWHCHKLHIASSLTTDNCNTSILWHKYQSFDLLRNSALLYVPLTTVSFLVTQYMCCSSIISCEVFCVQKLLYYIILQCLCIYIFNSMPNS